MPDQPSPFPAAVRCFCGCLGREHRTVWRDGEFKGTRCDAHGGHKFAMGEQPPLFDAHEGERRKRTGQERAASKHGEWLTRIREVAIFFARRQGFVSTDDLRLWGLVTPPGASENIWGAVFADSRFEFDSWVRSRRPEAHARMIRRWRLKAG